MHFPRPSPLTLLLATGLLLTGCMTFEVGSNISSTDASDNDSEIVHGSIYGYRWRDYHVQKCKESALAHVEVNFNWIELLASTFSLGFYVPQTVEWWCVDPNAIKDDSNEPGLNPKNEF